MGLRHDRETSFARRRARSAGALRGLAGLRPGPGHAACDRPGWRPPTAPPSCSRRWSNCGRTPTVSGAPSTGCETSWPSCQARRHPQGRLRRLLAGAQRGRQRGFRRGRAATPGQPTGARLSLRRGLPGRGPAGAGCPPPLSRPAAASPALDQPLGTLAGRGRAPDQGHRSLRLARAVASASAERCWTSSSPAPKGLGSPTSICKHSTTCASKDCDRHLSPRPLKMNEIARAARSLFHQSRDAPIGVLKPHSLNGPIRRSRYQLRRACQDPRAGACWATRTRLDGSATKPSRREVAWSDAISTS